MHVNVNGGTGAGRRMHRRTVPKAGWVCPNGHQNIRNATVCMTHQCREKRPKEQ